MGDKYLRKVLVVGATSPVRCARHKPAFVGPRLVDLLLRKPMRPASVAMANRMARFVWAVMTRGEEYQKSHAPMLAAENYMVWLLCPWSMILATVISRAEVSCRSCDECRTAQGRRRSA